MKKFIYYSIIFFPVFVLGQSLGQNYVKNIIYKTETTSALPASPDAEDGLVNVTYFDGLGRPIQQNAHKQSDTGNDIITHIEYDEFGRQVKNYLPYVPRSASMAFDTDAKNNTFSFYLNDWEAETSF